MSTLLSHRDASDDYINDYTAVSSHHISLCNQEQAKKFTLKIKETQFHLFYNLELTEPLVSADNAYFLVCFILLCLRAGDVDVDYPNTVQIKLVFR